MKKKSVFLIYILIIYFIALINMYIRSVFWALYALKTEQFF